MPLWACRHGNALRPVERLVVPTSPVDLVDGVSPDFEKRPAAPSVRRGAEGYSGRKRQP
jgi:hypothetical protein